MFRVGDIVRIKDDKRDSDWYTDKKLKIIRILKDYPDLCVVDTYVGSDRAHEYFYIKYNISQDEGIINEKNIELDVKECRKQKLNKVLCM